MPRDRKADVDARRRAARGRMPLVRGHGEVLGRPRRPSGDRRRGTGRPRRL